MGLIINMKLFRRFRMWAGLAVVLMVLGTRAGAQSFQLFVSAPSGPVGVSNSITYSIFLTNVTYADSLDTRVSNVLSGVAYSVSSTTNSQGTNLVSTNVVVFGLGTIYSGLRAQMALTVTPTNTGYLTNTITVTCSSESYTASTNLIIQVTNVQTTLPEADLAVGMTGPSFQVFSNDWMVYGVSVTNLGPNNATNVFLTNSLPSGVGFKSVWSTNQSFTYSVQKSNVVFNLSTLTNGAFVNFQLTVQPTNAGDLTFVSVVGTNTVLDLYPANNMASNTVVVSNFFSGQFTVVTNSPQTTNFQNGFIEQNVLLRNIGTNPVAAARVVVTGLTNRLFNAVGTNNGSPFVVYAAALETNQSVNLLLQYYSTTRSAFRFTNSQLQAYAVSVPDLAPPAVTMTSTNFNISRIIKRANGSILIEWPSVTNRTYTVVYSDNVMFSNAMIAPPSIIAPANKTQWVDYGPPTTVSHPTNEPMRFYRIFLNP